MNLLEFFSHFLFNIFKVMVIIYCQQIALSSQCPTLPGKILCNCDSTKLECSGIQTNITDVQDILANVSSVSNIIIRVIGLEFEPGYRFENMNITNLTLGYGLETPTSDLLFELGPSLMSLNLQNNSIEFIDDQLFSSLSNLTELFLDYNKLSELESSMFANLINLHYLSVSSNVFYEVNSDVFENLLFLHSLILSHNNISVFKNVNIKSLSLITLNLEDCSIKGAIENDTFLDLPNLEQLDLSYNSLSEVKPQSLSSLKNLVYLNLSHNIIEYVQENAFSELGNLLSLDLKSNKITLIKMSSFANLHNLKYLDMSENKLKALLCEYTVDFAALETVFLQDNEIKEFTSGTFFYSPFLKELEVSGNNLECSCELTDIAYFLIQNSTMKHENLKSINCIISSTLATMAITDFKSSKCVPEPPCQKEIIDDEYDYDYSDENTSLSTFPTISTTAFSTIVNSTFITETPTEKVTITHDATTLPTTIISSTISAAETSAEETTSSLITVIPNTTNGSTSFDNSSDIITDTTIWSTSTATETSTKKEITDIFLTFIPNATIESALFNDSTYTESETTTIYSTIVENTSDSILHDNISTIIKTVNITETSSTSNENVTNLHTKISSTTHKSSETTFTTLSSDDDTKTTNTIIPSSSEETSAMITKVTNAVTTKSLCSSLELTVDSLTTDPEVVVIKNFSYDGHFFCLKWTIQNMLPARSRCVIKFTFIKGTKSENLQCPSSPGEVKLWSKSEKIFHFCINIYTSRKMSSCSKISEKTTTTSFEYTTAIAAHTQTPVKIETSSSTNPTTEKLTESSIFMHTDTTTKLSSTVIFTDTPTAVNTDSSSTVLLSYSSQPLFNVTSFDLYFNTSSYAYVKWNVNKNEALSVCNLNLTTTTQYFDHNEGSFPCERNTFKLQNVKEGEIFKICLSIHHIYNDNSFICKHSLGNANFAAEKSKSNDSPNHNSSLIPLVCLLILLVLIVIFIIFKNLFNKRQETDVYDVRAEEEKSQKVQIRTSTHDRSSMRYSYIAKENPYI